MHAGRAVDLEPSNPPVRTPREPGSVLASARSLIAGPGARSTYALVLLLLIIVLFALPTSFGLGISGSHAVPVAPVGPTSHPTPSTARAVATPLTPASGYRLPGSDPSLLPHIDGPALANSLLNQQAAHPVNWTAVANQIRSGNLSPPLPAAPHPASGYTCPKGNVVGVVHNQTGAPVQGATVQSYSASGASSCPLNQIPPVTTNVTGGFNVQAPVGADYLTFTLSFYLGNITYVHVYLGTTTYLNATVYMIQDAIATGTVEANNSKHTPIAGVQVSAVARDQSQICNPSASTSSNGKFTIALCPLPSSITFTPPYGYLSTFRYANATPGQHIDLGIIYLETEPAVKVTLYNAVTRTAIPAQTCFPFSFVQCNSIKVCSSATNVCLNQGPTVGSATVQALGPKGFDYIVAEATGYVTNSVPIGWVNQSMTAPPIYMVPIGAIGLWVSVTQNATTPRWGTGMWIATACTMNGVLGSQAILNPATFTVNMSTVQCMGGCSPISKSFVAISALPLRNDINVAPDTTGACTGIPTWPTPGSLPVWPNETYANVTPDTQTNVFVNLTPGNYVYGTVGVGPLSLPPGGGFTTLGTSQDNPTLTAYGYVNTGMSSTSSPWMCSGYAWTTQAFCTPVPPGPGKIRVSSLTQNYSDNYTWGSTPYMCCYKGIEPMTLGAYTDGQTQINLTQVGSVKGHVFQGDTHVGVFFGSVKVSAAGNHPLATSFDGAVYLNGTFQTQAPLGWVSIQASASGYAPNTVWAWVNSSQTTDVGNITLTPLATLQGRLIDPTGHGIFEASVKYCHVDSVNQCSTLGAGLSTTDGQFNGTLLGGWLPWTTYMVQVSAAGYTSDWSWANTTAGLTTVLPPITLYPVGTNSTNAVHRLALGSAAAGVWIDGTLLDHDHLMGVGAASIQACPVDGSLCSLIHDGSNSQGYFNDSIAPGLYNLTVSAAGYFPASIFFNASRAAYLHLGAIYLFELPWVHGFASISPYGLISVRHGSTWVQIPMAPGATAFACNRNSSVCGTSLTISSQGEFFIQTGGGVYNKVQVSPSGGNTGPSSNGGFGSNQTTFNSTDIVTNLTTNLTMAIYAEVGGFVYDNSTAGPTGQRPWIPARWTPVSLATLGPNHAAAAWTTNGGGFYLFFVPAGPTNVLVLTGVAPEATIPKNISVNLTNPLNNSIPASVAMLPQINLTHFGWIEFRLVNAISGAPAAYVGVSVSVNDPLNGTLSSNGVANAFGFVNLTAPPGNPVMVSIGTTEDFNSTSFNVSVNSSRTTLVNGTSVATLGTIGLQPFGWVRSVGLNNSSIPNVPTVIDKVNGLPLPLASVSVFSQMPGLSGSSLPTNWMGQFISDAPAGLRDSVTVSHWAFLTNTSVTNVAPNQVVVMPTINMTGLGILAGRVLQYPGTLPIPFASVQTCPLNATGLSSCWSTTTNDSGIFWVASYPGRVTVTVTANGFVSNTTTIAQSGPDTWTWLPAIVLNEFSYVFGTVRALPSGLPIDAATVAACSPLGTPVGACGFSVLSASNGQFLLAVPAGAYILQANASGFNATYLPVYLLPGETLPVGILFLKQYGQAFGTVLSSATLLPVANASVFGCPTWSGSACTPTSLTDSHGQFTIAGPPGPYTIAVLANGYSDSYSAATLISGVKLTLPAILITPLGTNIFYQVSGQVVNASDPGSGIDGAIVSVMVNGTPAFSTRSDVNGGFLMDVLWGTYVLSVISPGYVPARQPVVVHNNVYGLLVSLQVMTFSVSGTVADGLTSEALSGVTLQEGINVVGVSDFNGYYNLQLPNGTHSLTATYEGGGTVAYAPIDFQVVVNGAAVVHLLSMVPPSVLIRGVVVDSLAGTPLPGAVVTLRGMTVDGVPIIQTISADPSGGFSATLYMGSYNASSTYTGYLATTVPFSVTPAGQSVPIPLHPESNPSGATAASGNSVNWVLGSALAVVVAAALVLGLVVRARRRTPAPQARAKPGAARRSSSAPASAPKGGTPPRT